MLDKHHSVNMPKETKREPNQQAAFILAAVDLLPPGLPLPDLESENLKLARKDSLGLFKSVNLDRDELLVAGQLIRADSVYRIEALEACLESLPEGARGFVLFGTTQKVDHQDALYEISRYIASLPSSVERITIHMWLTFQMCDRYNKLRAWYVNLYQLATNRDAQAVMLTVQASVVSIKDGWYDFPHDEFKEAFRKVRPERIGVCENCGRVFWKARLDMKACTKSCARILRTNRWREKVSPEKKTQYHVNRKHREFLKDQKNKNRGD